MRIAQGKQATRALHGLIWHKTFSEDIKKRLFVSIDQECKGPNKYSRTRPHAAYSKVYLRK